MRTRAVHRHYCDFCGKGMFKIPSMEKHERHCTANPNRICKMCVLLKQKQPETQVLVDFAKGLSPAIDSGSLERYRKFCGGCPACMLAGVRQADICTFDFNYKEELELFWSQREEAQKAAAEFATY